MIYLLILVLLCHFVFIFTCLKLIKTILFVPVIVVACILLMVVSCKL